MKRFLTLAALVLTAATSAAGNLRDRIAARFARPTCQPCQTQAMQVQPTYQPVQYTPPAPVYTQPVQTVQTVSAYQPAGFSPVRTVCVGGQCK